MEYDSPSLDSEKILLKNTVPRQLTKIKTLGPLITNSWVLATMIWLFCKKWSICIRWREQGLNTIQLNTIIWALIRSQQTISLWCHFQQCTWKISSVPAERAGQGEVGRFTCQVKTAWPCLDFWGISRLNWLSVMQYPSVIWVLICKCQLQYLSFG